MASQPCRRRQADFRSETATRIDPLSRETRPRGQPGIGLVEPGGTIVCIKTTVAVAVAAACLVPHAAALV